MLPVEPEIYQQYVEQHKQLILAGHRPFDSSFNDNPVKLSDCIRVRKLVEAVGDLQRVLVHLAIHPECWREADYFWRGSLLMTPEMTALHILLLERIDVSKDAALIAAMPPLTTRGVLELGGTVVALGLRQVLIIGHVLRDGKAFLRACDLLGRKVLWESASALQPWAAPPPSRSFRVFGTRVILVHERRLTSMKLLDGQEPWTVELPGSEAFPHEEDLKLFHVPLAETPGVVAIEVAGPAGSHTLLAFDEDSGLLLWQLMIPEYSATIRAIPEVGLMIHTVREQRWVAVHDARSGAVLTTFGAHDGQGSGWVERVDRLGTTLVLYVGRTQRPAPGEFSLLLVDPRNGRLLEMVRQSSVNRHGQLLEVDQRPLWLRWEEKSKGLRWLERYPDPHRQSSDERWERWLVFDKIIDETAWKGHGLVTDEAIVIAYNVLDRAPEGGSSRGILLFLDRRTLVITREIQLEGGVGLPEPGRDTIAARRNLLALGSGTVSVFDLRTGQQLWEMPVPGWRSQRFLGVWLLVTTRTGWLLIEPESGTLVASWPLDG